MGIDFNGVNSNQLGKTSGRQSNRTQADPAKADRVEQKAVTQEQQKQQKQSSVHLSPDAKSLKRLEDAAARLPVVNRDRVDAIKKQIAEGNYKVDARRVADKLIEHEELYNPLYHPANN